LLALNADYTLHGAKSVTIVNTAYTTTAAVAAAVVEVYNNL
jgi:hypothetical protein